MLIDLKFEALRLGNIWEILPENNEAHIHRVFQGVTHEWMGGKQCHRPARMF